MTPTGSGAALSDCGCSVGQGQMAVVGKAKSFLNLLFQIYFLYFEKKIIV